MIIIPVAPVPYSQGKRGMKQDPLRDYMLAIQSYLPLGYPAKTVCFIVESKTDSGNLTEEGEDIWLLAKAFMTAVSKSNQISKTPGFEKRTGTIAGIYVY